MLVLATLLMLMVLEARNSVVNNVEVFKVVESCLDIVPDIAAAGDKRWKLVIATSFVGEESMDLAQLLVTLSDDVADHLHVLVIERVNSLLFLAGYGPLFCEIMIFDFS